jgi:hypothetical protein
MAKSLTTSIIPVVAILVISLVMLACSPSQESIAADQAVLTEQEAIDIAFTYLSTVNAGTTVLVDQRFTTAGLTKTCMTGDRVLKAELRSNGRWVVTFPGPCVFVVIDKTGEVVNSFPEHNECPKIDKFVSFQRFWYHGL